MIKCEELNLKDLQKYDEISFSFKTNKKYEIKKNNRGLNGFTMELIDTDPFEKQFETNTSKWIDYFGDLSNWKIYVAKDGDKLIGGCVIATKTPNCDMLDGRDDIAVLWDIRVEDGYKHQGIGQKLFDMGLEFCKKNNFKQLKIECQNINPAAINFYHKQGAVLCAIDEYAYKDFPNETQLIWYIDIK